ncbi:MAG TPA: hypothetical protein PKW35_07225 [Nannocystaceae bacterium]|nr:hypothetical protein [Nannocystaceae bacterium]
MSEPTTNEENLSDEPAAPRRRRRSPIVDLVVSAFGIYMLVSMFGDFRYWLRSGQPVDLGNASELVASGLGDDLDEAFVVLRGTPDVQHAARLKSGERSVSYVRIVEGGGSLFAAMERREDGPPNQYEGVFEGRMRRLGKLRMLPWIRAFFDAEGITQTVDVPVAALIAALPEGGGGGGLTIQGEGESYPLGAEDHVGIAVELPDAQIQLGRESFASLAAAEAAVAALGVPYFVPEQKSSAFYKIFARIPAGERRGAEATLAAGLVAPPRPDPSHGVAVLPTSATYLVPASALDRAGDRIRLVHGESTTTTGFVVDGERLAPRPLEDGRLVLDPATVRSVHLSRAVRVDDGGYLIVVGETPSSQWMAPLLWGGVLVVVLWNLASLGWWWRSRRA